MQKKMLVVVICLILTLLLVNSYNVVNNEDIYVSIYNSEKALDGTTLFFDSNSGTPRIIEINMIGDIIWEYVLPDTFKNYTNPGFDVEILENNHSLYGFHF